MKKTINLKKIIKYSVVLIIAVALIGAIIFSVNYNNSSVRVIRVKTQQNIITNKAETAEIHYAKSETAFSEKVAASGLIELFVDPASNSFGIFETGNNRFWSALPLLNATAQGEELNSEASMATLRILNGSDIYYLNTQDNSLDYKTASYKPIENGAEFTFDLFSNPETAAKTSFDKKDIGFRIVISVSLKDGSMLVDCKHSNLTGNPDAYIESIDLLNYFGAYNDSLEDDYILVPDGSGAIIKTSIYDESFESLSFDIYGNDISVDSDSESEAVIPAFGIKHGKTAFVSLIQNGDAIATVNAEKATSLSEYNRVYSSFRITPIKYEEEKIFVSRISFNENISLCYRFLTGNNATYSGLASACREQLIRNSVISTKTVSVSDYIPCFLSLTGAVNSGTGKLIPLMPATTFEQATDMLIHMKSKGINNISVRYSGIFNGGANSEDAAKLKINSESGGEKGLKGLMEYASSQKMNIYLDINLLSSSDGFTDSPALNILNDKASYFPEKTSSDFIGYSFKPRTVRAFEKLKETVTAVISRTSSLDFSGFCINDAGYLLYSDFGKGVLRNDAEKTIASCISPLSTSKSTMAIGGNFYILKNIDSIINLPMNTASSASGAYVSVPFVPLILHGTFDYTGDPINTRINIEETLLKYIEYGACPHFAWSYEPVSDNPETDIYYYDNTINTASEYYKKANETLNDLRDARMTDHYQVSDGVFCTEYDTGSLVYVNYTDSDYDTLGVTVSARSFTRVN